MKKPELHVLEFLDGRPVRGECTICPYPDVYFAVTRVGTAEDNQAILDRQFSEHIAVVHSR